MHKGEEQIVLQQPVELQFGAGVQELLSYSLFVVAKEMRKASNFSSITSGAHKMIPFMALVSCIFNTDYSNTEHHSHQERLTWLNHEGLKYTLLLHGDGSCCFTASAFSLKQDMCAHIKM